MDGYTFHGSRYRLGEDFPSADSEAVARESAAAFAPGAKVTVHHDPDNPASAVLDTSNSWAARWTAFLLGVLLTAMGVALWVWAAPLTAALRKAGPVDLSG